MISLPDVTLAARYVIKTHYIMRVLKFHPETQTVDIIQDVFEFANTPMGQHTVINEFGNEVTVAIKKPDILYGVPVKQERWGQFEIQCCPKEGDTGYIEVFTNDILDWIQNGSRSIPWSDAHFLKTSCVFVPFIPNHTNAVKDYPTDNSQLVIKSAHASIVITDSEAKEGSGSEPTVDVTTTAQTVNINAEKGVTVKGDINVTGDITATGNVTVEGTISATGDIKSTGGDVVAGGVSLKDHTHMFTYSPGPSEPVTVPTAGPTPTKPSKE